MKTLLKKIIIPILRLEAKLILRKYKPRVVVVTGNVGKTSSKDAVYAVLKNFGYARKSYKSYNSEIGVPLTILGASSGWSDPVRWLRNLFHGLSVWLLPHEYPQWLALEVGADRPGDIEKISQWLFADVAVLTRLAKVPVHVEYFGSPEKVFEEKEQILKTLKDDGILAVNFDDEEIMKIAGGYRGRVVTYGFSKGADICAGSFRIRTEKGGAFEKPIGVSFRLAYGNSSLPISIENVSERERGAGARAERLQRRRVLERLGNAAGDVERNVDADKNSGERRGYFPRVEAAEHQKNKYCRKNVRDSEPERLDDVLPKE